MELIKNNPIFVSLCVFEKIQEAEAVKTRSSFLGSSFKFGPSFMLIYSNTQSLCSSDNFRYVMSSRTHDTNVLSGSINVEKLQRLGKLKV
jgi:hypothetical protein